MNIFRKLYKIMPFGITEITEPETLISFIVAAIDVWVELFEEMTRGMHRKLRVICGV